MVTRYEFGYGYGDIYRRRMSGHDRMHRRFEEDRQRLPRAERRRYGSDYYDFHGAGRRSGYAREYRVQPRFQLRSRGPSRGFFRRR